MIDLFELGGRLAIRRGYFECHSDHPNYKESLQRIKDIMIHKNI